MSAPEAVRFGALSAVGVGQAAAMAYIIERMNRFHVVAYDGLDALTAV